MVGLSYMEGPAFYFIGLINQEKRVLLNLKIILSSFS